jgi:hypothetical protein
MFYLHNNIKFARGLCIARCTTVETCNLQRAFHPLQAQAWPLALAGRDIIQVAQPRSGKTVAFLVPTTTITITIIITITITFTTTITITTAITIILTITITITRCPPCCTHSRPAAAVRALV